jgi:hypothetical protein
MKLTHKKTSRKEIRNFSFIESIVNDHYKSYKLDYMYNYLDFFSNKYRVRRKITEEMKRKVSIPEINTLLNRLVSTNGSTKRATNNFNVMDILRTQFGAEVPDFIDIYTKSNDNSKVEQEKKNTVINEVKKASEQPIVLSEADQYELEAYKGIKQDPLYKHYLHTHLAFFSEKVSDIISTGGAYQKGYVWINV